MNDSTLSRIPFLVRDELMIASMARWMRFIGAIKVVSGLLAVFILLVGMISVGAALTAAPLPGPTGGSPSITLTVNGNTRQVPLEKIRRFVTENQVTFIALGIFGLMLGAAATVLGLVLYHAADDFDRVARSDVADQDFITAGILKLTTYFKVTILLGVAAGLVAITAGISLVAQISSAN